MRLRLMHKLVRLILKKWRRYAQRRKGCRLAWFRRGYRMAENKVRIVWQEVKKHDDNLSTNATQKLTLVAENGAKI
jgi:hypothetical protein